MSGLADRLGCVTYPPFPGADLVQTARIATGLGFSAIEPTPDLTGIEDPAGDSALAAEAIRQAQRLVVIPALAAIAEAWGRFTVSFDTLLAEVAQSGVKLAYKPILGTLVCHAETTRHLVARYGHHAAFGLTFDPSHVAVHGDDVPATIAEFQPYLVNVHLKDAFGHPGTEGRDYHFPPLGAGAVDRAALFAGLQAIGYAGPLSILNESTQTGSVFAGDPTELARRGLGDATR